MRENDPNFDIFQTVQTDEAHKQWYIHEKDIMYTGAYPFPWTRLGYTYDYYRQAEAHESQGLSEFVVQRNIPIIIYSITPVHDYI